MHAELWFTGFKGNNGPPLVLLHSLRRLVELCTWHYLQSEGANYIMPRGFASVRLT